MHLTPASKIDCVWSVNGEILLSSRMNRPMCESIETYLQSALGDSDVWKTWLVAPEQMVLGVPAAHESEAKVRACVVAYQAAMAQRGKHGTIHLHSMEWSWILNYNAHNRFDFEERGLSILHAKNGEGKSNFLEVICLSLFGEGFPSRYNKHHSSSIICDKKPSGTMACTLIRFSIQGTSYTLKRVLKRNHDKRAINFHEVVLSECGADGPIVLHQGQGAVSQWIGDTLGSFTTFLMTAMLSQNADGDFFSDKSKQKHLLDQTLEPIQAAQLFREAAAYYAHVRTLFPGTHERLECISRRDTLLSQWNSFSEQELSAHSLELQARNRIMSLEEMHVLLKKANQTLLQSRSSLYRKKMQRDALLKKGKRAYTEACDAYDAAALLVQRNMADVQKKQALLHTERLLSSYVAWVSWKQECAREQALSLQEDLLNRATQYESLAGSIAGLLEGYRKWMYVTQIAPRIQSCVNQALHPMGLQLESEWLEPIDSLSWFIREEGGRVLLERASGFQRCVVGIAMRAALQRVSRIQYDQLFIDEGFTICDADHFQQVPSFLRGLLPLYPTIYVATHVGWKDCVPICIAREDGLSHLQSSLDTAKEELPKKKGRPPKVTVVRVL